MNEGTVALAALPQADGTIKQRPVLLLRQLPGYGDWLVCGISTQLWQEISGFDDTIATADADFTASGLKAPSLIRLGFLAQLPRSALSGGIGQVCKERHQCALERLSRWLAPRAA